MSTKVNGTDPRMAACWRAVSPPTSSIAQAMPAIRPPSTSTTYLGGSSEPREAMVAMVIAAASAPLMKNRAIRKMHSAEVIIGSGSASSAVNSDSSGVATAPSRSA